MKTIAYLAPIILIVAASMLIGIFCKTPFQVLIAMIAAFPLMIVSLIIREKGTER